MDNKKLIAGFGYQEGRISSWDGREPIPRLHLRWQNTAAITERMKF